MTRHQAWTAAGLVGAAACVASLRGASLWAGLTGVVSLYGLGMGLGVSFPRFEYFGPILWRGGKGSRAIALTFDDGPDPAVTPAVLRALAEAGVRATFFWVGRKVDACGDVARAVAGAGHEIGNHSHAHGTWTNLLCESRLREDIERGGQSIARVTGEPPRIYRPPMGLTNPRVMRVARALGLTVVGWSVRPFDRRGGCAERVARRVLSRLHPGAIVALHDSGVDGRLAAEAVVHIVKGARERGYAVVAVGEMRQFCLRQQ